MFELAKVALQNEMDLVIAHKRSMKIAELCGLGLSAQTTFATAVSEISRSAIENSDTTYLRLGIDISGIPHKYIIASIDDHQGVIADSNGYAYAKKLVQNLKHTKKVSGDVIELFFYVPTANRITQLMINSWSDYFSKELPISPYDEIRKKNEQLQLLADKLAQSESQYKLLTNSVPLVIFSVDRAGRILYANEWLRNFTGYGIDTLNETKWEEVIHEADYSSFRSFLDKMQYPAFPGTNLQCRIKNRQHEYIWHIVSVSPLKDNGGHDGSMIGFMADIHAQKIYEQTLKDNRELQEIRAQLERNEERLQHHIVELDRSNNELQQFAYAASHDLQEPVRKIIYFADFVLQHSMETIDKKNRDYLEKLIKSAGRMRILIKDILSFSRITRQHGLIYQSLDLNHILNAALQNLELLIVEKQVSVTVKALPVIEGDPELLQQLFENIISNAIKYRKESEIPRLDINAETQNDRVVIVFEDNGIGFNNTYSEQIFTLFQRLHSRDSYEGTGLGLAICRKIAELHNGTITAIGLEQVGARFFLSLPIKSSNRIYQ